MVVAGRAWPHSRFNLSLREVEAMMFERGVMDCYEASVYGAGRMAFCSLRNCVASHPLLVMSGISMKSLLGSMARNGCCGARLIGTDMCSMRLFNPVTTLRHQSVCCFVFGATRLCTKRFVTGKLRCCGAASRRFIADTKD